MRMTLKTAKKELKHLEVIRQNSKIPIAAMMSPKKKLKIQIGLWMPMKMGKLPHKKLCRAKIVMPSYKLIILMQRKKSIKLEKALRSKKMKIRQIRNCQIPKTNKHLQLIA